MKKLHWKTLSSKVVYQNPWITVREDKVLRPNGQEGIYGTLQKGGSVFIVAVNKKKEIFFVGQQRYTTKKYSLEIPAGGMEKDKPLVAAKRELWEETGLKSKKWKKIGMIQIHNSISPDVGHMYLAQEVYQTGDNKQWEEGIYGLQKFSLSQVFDLIQKGKLTDCPSLAALLFALPFLKNSRNQKNKMGILRAS